MLNSSIASSPHKPSPTPALPDDPAAQNQKAHSAQDVSEARTHHGPMRKGLRKTLFEAVAPIHASVTDHSFFAAITQSKLSRAQLAGYLVDQDFVLTALENTLLMRADMPLVAPLVDVRVNNRAGLALADAATLGCTPLPPPTPAACRLAAHIFALGGAEDGAALSVHAWVQYNALLNGGQQTAYALRKQFPQTRMTLYTFTPPAAQLRAPYANAINALDTSAIDEAHLCCEARHAFTGYAAMLDDVMARRTGHIGELFDAL